MSNIVITVMEIVGTVSFAMSGSIIAARYGLDLFGVVLVGCVTAVCGGILRDVFLGRLPPAIFSSPLLLGIAAAASLLVFAVFYINARRFEKLERKIETVNIFFDAVGLAAFSIIGMEAAFKADKAGNALLIISMGVITGIGGGIVRDVLVDKIPYVLKKHIYALASIIGCIVYYVIRQSASKIAALVVAIPLIVVIRLLAARYHWKLPKIHIDDER